VDLPEPEGPVMRMIWPGVSRGSLILGSICGRASDEGLRPNHLETRELWG
jgi:hypothetical protein